MLTVTVAHNDTSVSVESDAGYSPDLLDDMCRRACGALIATLIQLMAAVEDE